MGVLDFPGRDTFEGIVGSLGRTEEIRKANLAALAGGYDAVQLEAEV